MTSERTTVRTGDGRDLDVLRHGPADAFPLVFQCGTPNAPDEFPLLFEAVNARGWQLVAYARPGYADSSRHEGRSVADAAGDVAAILDQLGLDRFVTLGWSGGGPHALACAALLADRCDAVGSLAGVAPFDAAGLDFLAGMGPENVDELGAAARSRAELEVLLDEWAGAFSAVTAEQVAESLGGLVDEVDRAALTGEFAETMARMIRRALSTGIAGWLDDDLAFVKPWGFELAAITVPVSIWQGAHDRMVPFAHGEWLASAIPGARAHLYDGEGHISLAEQMPRILEDLVSGS
jgi:pimeloyl-ACP methyl ester carboxylesterase